MAKKLTIPELQILEAQCVNLMRSLEPAIGNINIMAETNATRELSMVRTKIEEATMWLEKYQSGIIIELANRTCR